MSNISILGGGSGGIPATGSMTWYVATTGSNSNPGTNAAPFLTIQYALNVAAGYNYQNLYSATINIAAGTYSQQLILPALYACPSATLSGVGVVSCNIADTGTSYATTVPSGAEWNLSGINIAGTYGGLSISGNVTLTGAIGFSGNFANEQIFAGTYGSLDGILQSITITSTSSAYFFRSYGGICILDGTTITFSNAITYSQNLVFLDSTLGFFGFTSWMGTPANFVNPGNVTTTSNCLHLQNGAYFECNTGSQSSGSALTRANFPGVANGSSVFVDQWSRFTADNVNSGNLILGSYTPSNSLTDAIAVADGAGNLRFDYNITHPGAFTFATVNSTIFVTNTSTDGLIIQGPAPGLYLKDTETNGGFGYFFSSVNGSTPYIGFQNLQSPSFPTWWASSYDGLGSFQLANGSVFGWSSAATYADGAAMDTGISRVSAGLVGVGTGTAGSVAGSLEAADLYTNDANFMIRTKATLANGAGSSAGTLTTAPSIGNPTKWIPIDDNGTTRHIPAW